MTTFYIACAILGGVVVALQSVFGLFGDGDGDGHDASADTHDTLDLISLRSLAAGLTSFGLAGGLLTSLGLWWWLTLPAAAVVGFLVLLGVALVIRQMGRLEKDASLILEGAVGEEATVYIPIPARRGGRGKVTVILQEQSIELEAETEGEALATGESVVIIDIDGAVVRVVPSHSRLQGAS